jgi:hypothetical protein
VIEISQRQLYRVCTVQVIFWDGGDEQKLGQETEDYGICIIA